MVLALTPKGRRLWVAYDESASGAGIPAIDGEGNIYVCSDNIKKYDRNGNLLWSAAVSGSRVLVGKDGCVYAAGTIYASGFPGPFFPAYFAAKLRQGLSMAPVILTSPVDEIRLTGESVTLSVGAQGSPPLRFQWRLGGQGLSGATNQTLAILDLDFSKSGWYSVVVSNNFGVVRSSDVLVAATSRIENPRFKSDGNFEFSFRTEITRAYGIEASTNALDWVFIGQADSTSGMATFIDPASLIGVPRFYRVLLQ